MKKILCFAALLGFVNLAFAQNSNPWPTAGSVGIGTSNPTTGKLVINTGVAAPASALDIRNNGGGASDNAAVTWAGGAYGFMDFNPSSGQGIRYSALGPLVFGSNTNAAYGSSIFTEAMRVTATGNVGIGTVAPVAKLTSVATTEQLRLSYDATHYTSLITASGGSFSIAPNGLDVATFTSMDFPGLTTATGQIRLFRSSSTTGPLGLAIYAGNGTGTTNTYLSANGASYLNANAGNLGIGITTPGLKTHINGATGFPATTGTAQTGVLRLQGSTSNSVLDFGVNGSSGAYLQATSQNALNTTYPLLLNPNGGNVGIGIINPTDRLAVNGTIHTKEVRVDLEGWADYVFKKDYKLPTLTEVKDYIDQNHHLPDMPSEKEVMANGLNLGAMNKILTKKVEELTLYLIEKDQQLKSQREEIDQLKEQFREFKKSQR